jgi:hypothetical protein
MGVNNGVWIKIGANFDWVCLSNSIKIKLPVSDLIQVVRQEEGQLLIPEVILEKL